MARRSPWKWAERPVCRPSVSRGEPGASCGRRCRRYCDDGDAAGAEAAAGSIGRDRIGRHCPPRPRGRNARSRRCGRRRAPCSQCSPR